MDLLWLTGAHNGWFSRKERAVKTRAQAWMSKSLQADKKSNAKSFAKVSERFYPNLPLPQACLTALAPLPQLLSDAVLIEAGPGAEGRVKIIDGSG